MFDFRLSEGFFSKFVRDGIIVDVGYKGAFQDNPPIFQEAIGLDLDTPGYNGRDLPFQDGEVATVHASHVLEHISDYGYFFREAVRVLKKNGTLLIFVPLMDAYERKATPPSRFNSDHRRFYTASRLIYEIETSLPRNCYRIIHLREMFLSSDLTVPCEEHAEGPYEIECVLEKL